MVPSILDDFDRRALESHWKRNKHGEHRIVGAICGRDELGYGVVDTCSEQFRQVRVTVKRQTGGWSRLNGQAGGQTCNVTCSSEGVKCWSRGAGISPRPVHVRARACLCVAHWLRVRANIFTRSPSSTGWSRLEGWLIGDFDSPPRDLCHFWDSLGRLVGGDEEHFRPVRGYPGDLVQSRDGRDLRIWFIPSSSRLTFISSRFYGFPFIRVRRTGHFCRPFDRPGSQCVYLCMLRRSQSYE